MSTLSQLFVLFCVWISLIIPSLTYSFGGSALSRSVSRLRARKCSNSFSTGGKKSRPRNFRESAELDDTSFLFNTNTFLYFMIQDVKWQFHTELLLFTGWCVNFQNVSSYQVTMIWIWRTLNRQRDRRYVKEVTPRLFIKSLELLSLARILRWCRVLWMNFAGRCSG